MPRQRLAMILFALVIALGISSAPATGQGTVTVRFGVLYQTHSASTFDPIYPDAAKKYGLNVQIIPFQRYSDVQIALATGRIDVGAFGYANIPIMAEQNTHNVQIIAGQSVGAQGITLRKGVNARTWKDLEGLRIGVPPNSTVDNEVKIVLKEERVEYGKIHWVTFATMGPEVLQALKTGSIDGFVGWEPVRATAAIDGYGVYAPFDLKDTVLKNINGVIGANTGFLVKYPQAALGLLRALVETTDYLNSHKDERAKLAASKTGTSLPVTNEAIAHSTLTYEMYRQPAYLLAKAMYEFGLTKADHAPQVDIYMNYLYLTKATGKTKKALGG